jgi:hypothetical protein
LYTRAEVKTPPIFWISSIFMTPVLVSYEFTVPSNEFARVTDETTMTEFPGIYARPAETVSDTDPFVVGVTVTADAVDVLKILPDKPVGPCAPVGPNAPVGPSIPSKLTL